MKWMIGLLLMLAASTSAAAATVLHVEDRAQLTRLEAAGFGFEHLFGAGDAADLARLLEASPAYRDIVETVGGDLDALRAEFKAGGRPLREFTADETGRILDMRWLTAAEARFRLVGIVNRLDRRDFHDLRGEAGCGEVRLIYRLAYFFVRDGGRRVLSSRMPFNLNAVFDVPADTDGGCSGAVARWEPPEGGTVDAAWLAAGPLDRSAIRFRQLELNAQIVRFPSGQEPEFGGQAVYLMRIFGLDGESAIEMALENTPDTKLLSEDEALRAHLVDYVRGNISAIDKGVYMLPDALLARKVVSFSTFGAARPINNPLAELFDASAFAELDLGDNALARSPAGLIARLDNGTCQGCHQASSTAGFHIIGLDEEATSPLNRIEVGVSPHFHAEQPRRAAYAAAVAEGREPNRFRPLSFAPAADWSGEPHAYRAAVAAQPCVMRDDPTGFGGQWRCGGGTQCTPLAKMAGSHLGVAQCLLPPDDPAIFSGHPCFAGEVTASTALPFGDRYRLTQFAAFAAKASPRDYTCRPPRIGVPGGMAYRQCDEKDRAFARFGGEGEMPREVCGLAGGKKFDLCVSTGNFDQCLAGAVQRGNRAACSAENPCRDDYICQAFPPDTPNVRKIAGVGFCSPTYFMFQMRIDNHTTPWRSANARALDDGQPLYRSIEAEPQEGDPDDWW